MRQHARARRTNAEPSATGSENEQPGAGATALAP
jgi:hypothetical protein